MISDTEIFWSNQMTLITLDKYEPHYIMAALPTWNSLFHGVVNYGSASHACKDLSIHCLDVGEPVTAPIVCYCFPPYCPYCEDSPAYRPVPCMRSTPFCCHCYDPCPWFLIVLSDYCLPSSIVLSVSCTPLLSLLFSPSFVSCTYCSPLSYCSLRFTALDGLAT